MEDERASGPARVVDSHTGGEPTRVVVSGGPVLAGETVAAKRLDLGERFGAWCRGVIGEPRGGEAWVGALLLEPLDPGCVAGVVFFNTAGPLQMCGHGAIGLVATLAHLGRIGTGRHRIETPAGVVTCTLEPGGSVVLENVPSYRQAKGVTVEIRGGRTVHGDVAWGGNWFFLVHDHGLELSVQNTEQLTAFAKAIRAAVNVEFPDVDHIELLEVTGPTSGKNFVLCPGGAYDRSPCGTGTSATMACRFADGVLDAGETWVQEGVTGSVFEGSVVPGEGREVLPTVRGRAFVTGEAELHFAPGDPFRWGIC